MYIWKGFFPQDSQQKKEAMIMCNFIICVYFRCWFRCTTLAEVPELTLKLHHDLEKWSAVDCEGSKAAMQKLDLHTDYLNGRSVVVDFASKNISDDTKEKMAKNLLQYNPVEISMGKPSNPRVYSDSTLEEFINEDSWLFLNSAASNQLFRTSMLPSGSIA